MKNINLRKALAFLLCALCVLTFWSCGAGDVTGDDTKAPDDKPEKVYLDDLPDLDYQEEKINIFYWDTSFLANELTADGSTGDVVDLAINNRNISVEERLNVVMNCIPGDIAAEIFMAIAADEILSGVTDYDVIIGPYYEAAKWSQMCIFRDMAGAKYIDLSKNYWNKDYIDELSLCGRHYMLVGDLSMSGIKSAATMTFDLDLFEQTFGPAEDFYELVFSGDGAAGGWTYDVLSDYCRRAYVDLNGNAQRDNGDRYGFEVGHSSSILDVMTFSTGVSFSHRDANGDPVIDVKTEKVYDFFSDFYRLFHENQGVRVTPPEASDDSSGVVRDVFSFGTMQDLVDMRAEERDFGVAPYPKYYNDDIQYHAATSPYTFSLPSYITDDRAEMLSAVLECMASEGSRLCVPAYYEIALKDKYTRDDASVEMLDIIHDGATTDFISAYNLCIGGVGHCFGHLISYEEPNLASWYTAKEGMVNAKLAELHDAYRNNPVGG